MKFGRARDHAGAAGDGFDFVGAWVMQRRPIENEIAPVVLKGSVDAFIGDVQHVGLLGDVEAEESEYGDQRQEYKKTFHVKTSILK